MARFGENKVDDVYAPTIADVAAEIAAEKRKAGAAYANTRAYALYLERQTYACAKSPKGAHYWQFDSTLHAVCKFCGQHRQFGMRERWGK